MPFTRTIRPLFQAVVAAGVLACAACLPTLTDAEVAERIAAANAKADVTTADVPATVDAGPPPTCGNSKGDPNEQCDDGNTDSCDGCAGCARALALKVDPGAPAVVTLKDAKYAVGPTRDLAWSAWFKVKAAGGVQTFLLHGASQGNAIGNMDFGMALALQTEGQLLFPTCYVRTLKRAAIAKLDEVKEQAVKAPASVQPGTWHHLRCVLSPTTNKLQAVLDEASNEVALGLQVPAIPQGTLVIAPAVPDMAPYLGLVDEVHVALAAGKPKAERRVVPGKDTIALFHMDEPPDSKQLADTGPQPVPTVATKGTTLTFAPSECYGFAKDVPVCTQKTAPWCN